MQTSLQLGSKLLKGLGVMSDQVSFLSQMVRNSMEIQAQDALDKSNEQELEIMKPLQVRIFGCNFYLGTLANFCILFGSSLVSSTVLNSQNALIELSS